MNANAQQAPATAANQASVEGMRSALVPRQEQLPDQAVNMFTERGFALAQRLAKAYAASSAVPAQFRQWIEKKVPNGRGATEWIENPAALGNCLVAIETAQSCRMSITAVMQNANVIEGKLSWSAQFVIAAINASGRFTPLEFDMENKGRMKAKYREKTGWDKEANRPTFAEREVEIDNWECRAWAMVLQNGQPTNKRVQGARVSMKMAVEEGWYGKDGSKWKTEMFEQMLMYRAGSFFGRIHAPDVIMGMGRTTEEVQDMTTIDMSPAGEIRSVTVDSLAKGPTASPTPMADVVQVNTTGSEAEGGTGGEFVPPPAAPGEAGAAGAPAAEAGAAAAGSVKVEPDPLTYAVVADAMTKATTPIEIDAARALIPRVVDAMQQAELNAMATKRTAEIAPAATKRRTSASKTSVE